MMSDSDGSMLAIPFVKKEVDSNAFALPTSPGSSNCSPTNQTKFSESSILREVTQCSPESPDHHYCTSTTFNDSSLAHIGSEVKDEEDIPRRICLVCGDIASGFHYGVASCEACKAFFKRTIQGNIEYTCPAANDCEINKRRRKACQACRFQKCLRQGMLKEGVRLDRVRGGRQKYRRSNDVPYLVTNSCPTKPVLEDNKMLEALLGCEPEMLTVVPESESRPDASTLSILSDLYDKELVNVIGWAKQIPGFTELSLSNQMRLLQSTWTEILTLSLAYRSLPPSGKLQFAVNFILDEIAARECGATELYQLCLSIMERLQNCSVCREEYILLKALVLANSDVLLEEAYALKPFRESIVSSLMDCVTVVRGNSSQTATILLCLPALRQVDRTLRAFWTNVHRRGTVVLNKLFIEMLDPSLRS